VNLAAQREPETTLRESVSVTFRATTVLPYEHVDRATAGLCVELRRQLLKANVYEMPLWEKLAVTGPREFTDLRGRTWYE
jgi:hypothetical protein